MKTDSDCRQKTSQTHDLSLGGLFISFFVLGKAGYALVLSIIIFSVLGSLREEVINLAERFWLLANQMRTG